jgi:ABC-type transport system involved in cytochrome c biogenesis permease subunit
MPDMSKHTDKIAYLEAELRRKHRIEEEQAGRIRDLMATYAALLRALTRYRYATAILAGFCFIGCPLVAVAYYAHP